MAGPVTVAVAGVDWPLRITIVLMNLAAALQAISECLLPSVYNELALSFNVSLSQLGAIQAVRTLIQAFFSLAAAYLVMHTSRVRLVGLATLFCALMTAGVAMSTSYWTLLACRAVDGLGLAVLSPTITSLIADAHHSHQRGFAFGMVSISYGIGKMGGNLFATTLAGTTVGGMEGWRASFYMMAALAALMGACILALAVEPREKLQTPMPSARLPRVAVEASLEESLLQPTRSKLQTLWYEVVTVLKIDSFKAIILQGVIGSYPWAAMAFFTMWLELVGFTHMQTAILMALFSLTCSLGCLIGGIAGDLAARHAPKTGRVIVAQFSALTLLPAILIIFEVLPNDSAYFLAYAAAFSSAGLLSTWNAASTNLPIFSEIVPADMRTTVYAADRMLESLLAAFGPYGVGYVAEKFFGFVPVPDTGRDPAGAHALGRALLWNILLPSQLCTLSIAWLYWTYPRDKARARQGTHIVLK